MKKSLKKLYLQQKKRFYKKIQGTILRPRLTIFKSHNHIYAQIIDDIRAITLLSSSTLDKNFINISKSSKTKNAAYQVGVLLAKKALAKQIYKVVLDKGNKSYFGRIKSLAEGARENGLII
jgi:large subunit ribosomal protein L18